MKPSTAIAKLLLEVGAVTFRPDDPFRGNTGMIIPIYTDGRVLLGHQPERKQVSVALENLVRTHAKSVNVVAGIVTSGIPWAAWIAASMNLPMIYVRDRPKEHGKKAQIEGVMEPGSNVLVVDDVVNTGSSLLTGIAAIRQAGGNPVAAVAISTYQLESTIKAFNQADVPLYTLTDFQTLLETALQEGRITDESHAKVLEWAADPAGWGKQMGFE